MEPRDHGELPPWRVDDLPEPLPFNGRNVVRTIGPGAILLAGSIGGGEWVVGPMVAVQYGERILWIATVGIVLQMMLNLEAIRYTLYTGEPILTGIMRLRPGPRLWAPFFIAVGFAQLAVPALALGCANVIFSAVEGAPPDQGDAGRLLWIAYGILIVTVLVLVSGRSIERVLERISWAMIILIFSFLVVANVLFAPAEQWRDTLKGFFTFGGLPDDVDIVLLALFAATAGSGGLGNLAITNWVRDKGMGMGGRVGGFGGVFAANAQTLEASGCVFPVNDKNLSRWRDWWRYTIVDQSGLWALGCAVGMFLNVNLALHIIPGDAELTGYAAGTFQAEYMAKTLWNGFWFVCLLNGFWVLLSTQIGNTDILVRTVSDLFWAWLPRVRQRPANRLYASVLLAVITWGVVALAIGENAISLFKVLGVVAGPVMAIAPFQILRVNLRFLPDAIRPPWWRRVGLVACGLFYGAVSLLMAWDFFQG